MPGVRFPAWKRRREVAFNRVWEASGESLGTCHYRDAAKRTLPVREVLSLSLYLYKVILSISSDASEEVSISRAPNLNMQQVG